ncbi:MAG: hypothetical protein ACT4OP_04005 [Actinomycetota bacterium]
MERPIVSRLTRAVLAPSYRHQLVSGPRRVGKTTSMYQVVRRLMVEEISPDRLWWIRLDHPLTRGGDEDEVTRVLESQRVLRSDAIERAIYKDIPQSYNIDNPMFLDRLLYMLAGQMTGILSPGRPRLGPGDYSPRCAAAGHLAVDR